MPPSPECAGYQPIALPPEPDCTSSYTTAQLAFVTATYRASGALEGGTGVRSDWILGWAAEESGWGVTGITPTQGNYFGWHGSGDILCPNGKRLQWHVRAADILNANRSSAASAFQALANAGYESNPAYGTAIAADIRIIDAIEDCLRSKGILQ